MPTFSLSRELPFRAEQVFELVADVERYPEFVPGWHSAVIIRRHGGAYITEQAIGWALREWRFRTKTILNRPVAIEVTGIDGTFRQFELNWSFLVVARERCAIAVEGVIEANGRHLNRLIATAASNGFETVIDSFERRAMGI